MVHGTIVFVRCNFRSAGKPPFFCPASHHRLHSYSSLFCQKASFKTATMKEVSPNSTNDASPADATVSLGSISDSSNGGGVAVAANRPTPSPAAAVAAAAAPSSSSSSNAAIEAKPETKAAVEIVTKNESREETVRNDGGDHPTCSIAATPLPYSTKNISTMSMSLQKSEEGTAVSYQHAKFTPIRSACSIVSQNIARGSGGNSIVATPGPTTSRSMDTNLLGQEMLGASATASSMMDGYGYDEFGLNLNGESPIAMPMTPAPPLHDANFVHHYPRQDDDYALPPFLQAHLDETYAASSSSSTIVLPPISAIDDIENGQQGEFLFQLTSYRPNLTASSPFNVTALGTAPPNPIGRRVAVNNGNVHTGSSGSTSSMAPLARAKKMATGAASAPTKTTAFFTSTSSTKNRSARSLPLRKRPVSDEDEPEMETADTKQLVNKEEKVVKKSSNRPRGPSTKKPSVKKPTLVRHNYNDNRSTCKCAKSRCLKLYCDCFQSGRMCDPAECECKSCMNLEKYSGPNGARTNAIDECLAKNPRAFEKRQKSAEEGCGCKKNK